MKVLNLQCTQRHSFEGWFGSENDFQDQLARGMVECPLCASRSVQKMPSAPRLNLGSAEADKPAAKAPPEAGPQGKPQGELALSAHPADAASHAEQAAFLKALRHVMANTEDVGEKFADEARRIHYGETEARHIRGQATAREAVELIEEGIGVVPLPLTESLKKTLQ